jgi:hypothetical protein
MKIIVQLNVKTPKDTCYVITILKINSFMKIVSLICAIFDMLQIVTVNIQHEGSYDFLRKVVMIFCAVISRKLKLWKFIRSMKTILTFNHKLRNFSG